MKRAAFKSRDAIPKRLYRSQNYKQIHKKLTNTDVFKYENLATDICLVCGCFDVRGV